MQVTRNVAELCALLIDEFHGALPSRIFAVLLEKGRLNVHQLSQYTQMSVLQLKHGLAVLLQHSLLYYHVENGGRETVYEANVEVAYNLVRAGKILEMIESSFSPAARDVMQSLLVSGQTRISDLTRAWKDKIDDGNKNNHSSVPMDVDDDDVFGEVKAPDANGNAHDATAADTAVKDKDELNSILCRLVKAELIDVVHAKSFQSPQDIVAAVEKEVTDKYFPAGVKGGKGKIDFQEKVAESLRHIRGESKSLKRKLEQNDDSAKRQKLNGALNGVHEGSLDPTLNPDLVIRVNYEKCVIDLRNRRLVQFVSDMIGETTSYVYGVLLKLLTKHLPRCRLDPDLDLKATGEEVEEGFKPITTADILDHLKTSVDLSQGFGKPAMDKVWSKVAEEIKEAPPRPKLFIAEAEVDGDASADEEDSESDDEPDYDADFKPALTVNGTTSKGDAALNSWQCMSRPDYLQQHLLLLANSPFSFVRHCGNKEWTVDFVPLMRALREAELDVVIERKSGRLGLKLVRVLRAMGKLDEKALIHVALMRKTDMQQKMAEMEKFGFVEIQEVPRDNKADVKKSFFLWFCDTDKSYAKLIDDSYKSMVRCLQTLEANRQKEKDVLMLTRRTDVKGREKDVMRQEYYERYSQFQKSERMLFGQLMRLDDYVALLRDF